METTSATALPVADRIREVEEHLRAGRYQEAIAGTDRLVAGPDVTAEALLFAAEVQFSLANFTGSEQLALRCTERFPDEPGGPVLRCRALQALGRMGEARDLALQLAETEIKDDAHVGILVTVLSSCLVPEAAYPLCRKSVARDPQNIAAQRRLALTCRLLGKFDEAVQAANIAIRADIHDYEMIGLRSVVRSATPERNNIKQLRALLAAGCRNELGAARVAYALAKECEELGRFDKAFGYLEAGAKFKRKTFNYDIATDLATFDILQKVFKAEALATAGPGFDTEEPIFILGLPRTGSTLVERIISSHSEVFAAGELNHFSTAMMGEVRKLGTIADQQDLVRKSLQADMCAIGKTYLELTRPATGHTRHFIDKLPLNFVSLGVIGQALPKAKIIHVRRTPLDACYAIYKFLFNQAYPWSYNLAEIAQYYVAYRKLLNHWRQVLPGRMIEVAYEDVVEDLETEAKRLIAELGLEWEPGCLDFHENKAAAMTGSAAQVRRKIYSSSVGRWRDYENQLQPLADALVSTGIDPFRP
jgi:tetratricopeptide (TPR) repeat protein